MIETLHPPLPSGKIPPGQLSNLEASGKYIVQRKFNGSNVCIWTDGQKAVFQHKGKPFKQFPMTHNLSEQICSLKLGDGETWLHGEFLGGRKDTPEYKRKLILFDVLQIADDYLFGINQLERLDVLYDICRHPTELEPHYGIALKVTPNVWLAQHWDSNFNDHFREFKHVPEIEGLMLRDKTACLDNSGEKRYEVSWMIRCRKSDVLYDF